jgi:hypothetical protein
MKSETFKYPTANDEFYPTFAAASVAGEFEFRSLLALFVTSFRVFLIKKKRKCDGMPHERAPTTILLQDDYIFVSTQILLQ